MNDTSDTTENPQHHPHRGITTSSMTLFTTSFLTSFFSVSLIHMSGSSFFVLFPPFRCGFTFLALMGGRKGQAFSMGCSIIIIMVAVETDLPSFVWHKKG
jgi:hypothetical protein